MQAIAARRIDIDRPVADHHGIAVDAPLRAQRRKLLPFAHADVPAAVSQAVQHFRNAVVERIFCKADVGVALAVARRQRSHMRCVAASGQEGKALVQRRPDAIGQRMQRTFGVAVPRERVIDGPPDAFQRIAQRAVEIEHGDRMDASPPRGCADARIATAGDVGVPAGMDRFLVPRITVPGAKPEGRDDTAKVGGLAEAVTVKPRMFAGDSDTSLPVRQFVRRTKRLLWLGSTGGLMTPQEVEAGATVVSAAMSVLAVALAWKANQTAGQARKDILRIDAVLTSLSNSPAYRMTDNATVSYSAGGGSGGNAAPGGIGGGGGGGGSIFGPGGSGGSGAAG